MFQTYGSRDICCTNDQHPRLPRVPAQVTQVLQSKQQTLWMTALRCQEVKRRFLTCFQKMCLPVKMKDVTALQIW